MNNSRLKFSICLMWIVIVFCFVVLQKSIIIASSSENPTFDKAKPVSKEIDDFNFLMQRRFLTEPSFGISRVSPNPPYSNHVWSFQPKYDEEKIAVKNFEMNGWKVGLFLFGRETDKKVKKGIEQNDFQILYRYNQPVAITNNIKREDLKTPASLLKEVKSAFYQFQGEDKSIDKSIEFRKNGWFYYAKPVRVANESCLKCHTDYAVLKKLDKGRFQFRKKQIGDVNGILVYGFKKEK